MSLSGHCLALCNDTVWVLLLDTIFINAFSVQNRRATAKIILPLAVSIWPYITWLPIHLKCTMYYYISLMQRPLQGKYVAEQIFSAQYHLSFQDLTLHGQFLVGADNPFDSKFMAPKWEAMM